MVNACTPHGGLNFLIQAVKNRIMYTGFVQTYLTFGRKFQLFLRSVQSNDGTFRFFQPWHQTSVATKSLRVCIDWYRTEYTGSKQEFFAPSDGHQFPCSQFALFPRGLA